MTKRPAIPPEVLASHLAILGKTGSGKTSTEKLAIEQVVADGFRVCVLDSVKSDWWGITSSADGKRPGLPFRILGGPRGHVPLPSSAGAVIGQLVGSGQLPHSIVDMADFEAGGLQRFFVDFAPALMRHARGVLYLVIEEAHEFAPKERAGIGAENLAIHWAKKLATAGRSKGIRLIVATQRVQSLHNAVLGSCETVIAHRLTTPADQDPVIKWLKANADKATQEQVAASLSSLPTGTGWLCSGEARIFAQIAFPKFKTYDNTATPMADGDEITVKTAPVDHDALRAIIGDAVKEAEANDPKALKAEISRLKLQLAKPEAAIDADRLRRVEEAAYQRGIFEGERREWKRAMDVAHARNRQMLDELFAQLKAESAERTGAPPAATPQPPPAKPAPPAPKPAAASPVDGAISSDLALTRPQMTLLRALAWWKAIGKESPTLTQAAVICGWSPNSSNVKDRASELTRLGLIDRPGPRMLRLTPAGIDAAPAPDLSTTVTESVRQILTNPQRTVLDELLRRSAPSTRDELAVAVGWSTNSSNIKDRLSELARLDLITRPGVGLVELEPWVRG